MGSYFSSTRLATAPRVQSAELASQTDDPNGTSFLDEDDEGLFRLLETLSSFYLDRNEHRCDEWSPEAWKRLGSILGQNAIVTAIILQYYSVDEADLWNMDLVGMRYLFAGLDQNRRIQNLYLEGINLEDTERMNCLTPLLRNNPRLNEITLAACNLGDSSIQILSDALLDRSQDTLKRLDLCDNNFGDIALDQLVLALKRNKKLSVLWLSGNGIGLQGCTSLAMLLEDQASNLGEMHLDRNPIGSESAITLISPLARNRSSKLRILDMHGSNNIIDPEVWRALLVIVCNISSISDVIESNHILHSVGDLESFVPVFEDADNLRPVLRLLLKQNKESNKTLAVRRKILCCHALGCFNIGDSSIPSGAMPLILDGAGRLDLLDYHLDIQKILNSDGDALGSIYRIIRSRPDLCNNGQNHLLVENMALLREIRDLRLEFRDLQKENEYLKAALVRKESRGGGDLGW